MQIQENSVLTKLQKRKSSWTKIKRVMAFMLVINDILLKRIDRASSWQQLIRIIDDEMIQKSQVSIIEMVQTESFKNEVLKHLLSQKKLGPK